MMVMPNLSTKRLAISRANTQMVAIAAVAAFVTIFCLFAARALLSQYSYQLRVTKAETTANNQLKKNISTYAQLLNSYQAFNSQPTNAIGGSSTGSGNNAGTNATIVLDALPSSYDFPALASSLEKILVGNNFSVTNITGTDDQLTEGSNNSSPNPQPVAMPFSFTVSNATYASVQQLMVTLEESIRPIQVDSIMLSGASNNMTLTVNAHTFYQPAKNLGIKTEVIK